MLAADRYAAVEKLLDGVLRRPERDENTRSDKLDAVLLHPVWGGVCLIAIMGLLFYLIFSVAEGPMDWIDWAGRIRIRRWVEELHGRRRPARPHHGRDHRRRRRRGDLPAADSHPVLLHRPHGGHRLHVARRLHHGPAHGQGRAERQSFVPFLSSYACAVPGIMATRTIASPKDRLVTILVAPLASCSARLPVYSLMIAAMFPSSDVPALTKAGIMLAMYALGTFGAFVFAWLFNRTLMKGAAVAHDSGDADLQDARAEHHRAPHAGAREDLPAPRRHRHPRPRPSCSGPR